MSATPRENDLADAVRTMGIAVGIAVLVAVGSFVFSYFDNRAIQHERATAHTQTSATLAKLNAAVVQQHADLCTAVAGAFPPGTAAQLHVAEKRANCPQTNPLPSPAPSTSSTAPSANAHLGTAADAAPTGLYTAGAASTLTTPTSARPTPQPSSPSTRPQPSPTTTAPTPVGCVLTVLLPIEGCP